MISTRFLCLLALATSTIAHEGHSHTDEAVVGAAEPLERPVFQPYASASNSGSFIEQFVSGFGRWSPSEATKKTPVGGETFSYGKLQCISDLTRVLIVLYLIAVGKWAVAEPSVFPGLKGDKGLVATSAAAHHAISAELDNVIDPAKEDLVVQYEVKLQNGLECGGVGLGHVCCFRVYTH